LIAMGISRFAYTPIFPLMKLEFSFTDKFAGYLASINYFGYLLGALAGGAIKWPQDRTKSLRLFLTANIISIVAMGLTVDYSYWFILRFIAGLTSGIVFVLIASIIMDFIAQNGLPSWAGLLYGGVGLGIFISGLLVPLFNFYGGWQSAWLGLGVLSIILGTLTWLWVFDERTEIKSQTTNQQNATKSISLPWLIMSYGLEGLGYIVSGTFLVAIINALRGFSSFSSSISWAFVGIAAAPSCILWVKMANRWGHIAMLKLAYFIQVIGISLPLVLPNGFGAIMGALLFGGTFMGITTITLSIARNMYPTQSSKVIGYLTFVYAIGQMIGPIVAGFLTTQTGSYGAAIIFASVVVFLAIILLTFGTSDLRVYLSPKNKLREDEL